MLVLLALLNSAGETVKLEELELFQTNAVLMRIRLVYYAMINVLQIMLDLDSIVILSVPLRLDGEMMGYFVDWLNIGEEMDILGNLEIH